MTPEKRDQEIARIYKNWQAASFIANRHSKDYGYEMDEVGISLLTESIKHALDAAQSTARSEGRQEAQAERDAAIADCRKALGENEHIGDVLDEISPGWQGEYEDALRSMAKRLEDAESALRDAASLIESIEYAQKSTQ